MRPSWRARWAAWVFVATVAGYPIVAGLSGALDLPNRPISIAFRALLTLASLVVIGAGLSPRQPAPSPWFRLVWIAFWALYLVRLPLDAVLNPVAVKLPLSEYIAFGLGSTLLPAVALRAADPVEMVRACRPALLAACALALALNIWVIFFKVGIVSTLTLGELRVETETLNPISIGHLGASALAVCLWMLCSEKHPALVRLSLVGVSALAAVAIVASASRGPMLALGLAVAAMFLWHPRFLFSPWILGMIGILLATVQFVFGGFDGLLVLDRLSEGAFNDTAREELLSDGVAAFLSHPVLGAGLEPLSTYPHNLVLESFMVFGLPSGLLFLGLLATVLVQCLLLPYRHPDLTWVSMLFLQYLAGAMVTSSLYGASMFWSLIVLVTWLAVWPSARSTVNTNRRELRPGTSLTATTGSATPTNQAAEP